MRARVGLDAPVFYAGLHGLEIQGPGLSIVHGQTGDARGLLQVFARALGKLTEGAPGVRVENKDVAIALHFRSASADDATRAADLLIRMASEEIGRGDLRLVHGNQVLELLPNVAWTQADAIDCIELAITRRRKRGVRRLCVGDGVADRDLLTRVSATGIAVSVGSCCPDAACGVPDARAATNLLERILHSASRARR